jgi:hypothetical protein
MSGNEFDLLEKNTEISSKYLFEIQNVILRKKSNTYDQTHIEFYPLFQTYISVTRT